jgi:hypothetical protein
MCHDYHRESQRFVSERSWKGLKGSALMEVATILSDWLLTYNRFVSTNTKCECAPLGVLSPTNQNTRFGYLGLFAIFST